ncbi:hypothetical protein EJB05_27404, partial [Eragrostis curvula]
SDGDMPMIGIVGLPVPNIDVCLETSLKMIYGALASKACGESCIRGYWLVDDSILVCKCSPKWFNMTGSIVLHGSARSVTAVAVWELKFSDIVKCQPDGSMKIMNPKRIYSEM